VYKTKHFELYELVPKAIYEATPKNKHHRLWGLFDDRALKTLDRLRDRYGSATVNDWHWGGNNQFGGWRPGDCEIGSDLSQHKFGRAFDPKFKLVDPENIRIDILEPYDPADELYAHIRCIEMDIPWLHFDVRNYTGLLKVYPS
tara:strand:- start:3904 stop:4335 length:432 start_codon:yes stop_codon:yes gene_type:complete